LVPPPFLKKLSLWLATASAVAILISVPASEILLALAIGVLMLSGLPLQWPRIAIPLGLFLVWTLLSLAFSPDPRGGLPQVNKMFVFVTMLTVYSSIRSVRQSRYLVWAWVGVGSVTAALGVFQFVRKWFQALAQHRDFYSFYVDQRITGFQNHWMTFSGQQLYLLVMVAAFLLFGPYVKKWLWIWLPCALMTGMALLLSDTRSAWVAAVVAGIYLLWNWKRWAVVAMPVFLAVTLLVSPAPIRQRAYSVFHPDERTDSNTFRKIVWRTGWEMIKAHPVFGLGPEEISKDRNFNAYLPKDIPRPLPSGFYKHLHSIYIHYAAERGIPAALFLTGALIMAFVDFQRALKKLAPGRSERRFMLHWASATILGTMVVGTMDLNLGLTAELTMFLVVMSLGYRAVASTDTGAIL
jgi:O-antigen ligase